MAEIVDVFLVLLAGLLAIPVTVLVVEIVAAILLPSESQAPEAEQVRCRVAVLVPAHNESAGLRPTIADIKPQLRGGDMLIVVADNCSDDTAAVAAAAGADVIERNDLSKIGKGYALDWGVRHLSKDAPAIVVVIDADCRIAANSIDRLARVCAQERADLQRARDPGLSHQDRRRKSQP